MSDHKKFFRRGLLLSPFLIGALWLFKPNSSVQTPESEESSVNELINLNFIPAKEKKAVTEEPFLFLSSHPNPSFLPKKLSDFRGKPIILHFWATWCPPCLEEMAPLDEYAGTLGDQFHVIVVACGDKTKGREIREFYAKNKIKNLSLFIDEKGQFLSSMGIMSLPVSVFINSSGEEIGRMIGAVGWMEEAGTLIKTHFAKV